MTDIQQLRQKISALQLPYNDAKMVEVTPDWQVDGLAFFPVGRGLWAAGNETLPKGGVLVLGQDFGDAEYTKTVVDKGGETPQASPTWRNLLKLLGDAKEPMGNCFFTNALMGLRVEKGMIGKAPGMKHDGFRQKCQEVFKEQLRLQQPRAVWVLGMEVLKFLLPLSPRMQEHWAGVSTLKELDQTAASALLREVAFEGVDSLKVNVAVLTHPSYWPNLLRREFAEKDGLAALITLMQDSLK